MRKEVSGMLGVGFFVFFIGFIAGAITIDHDSVRSHDMERCSVGQNTSLRNSVGNAVYRVTFKDGNAIKFECTRPATK